MGVRLALSFSLALAACGPATSEPAAGPTSAGDSWDGLLVEPPAPNAAKVPEAIQGNRLSVSLRVTTPKEPTIEVYAGKDRWALALGGSYEADFTRRVRAAGEKFGMYFTDAEAAYRLSATLEYLRFQRNTQGKIFATARGEMELVRADGERVYQAYLAMTSPIETPEQGFIAVDEALATWFTELATQAAHSEKLREHLSAGTVVRGRRPEDVVLAQDWRLAVLDLEPGSGMAPSLAQIATSFVLEAANAVPRLTAIGRDDISAMLDVERQKDLASCNDVTCYSDIGGAIGMDRIIHGSVAGLNQSVVLSLSLIDVNTTRVIARVNRTVTSQAAMQEQAREAIVELVTRAAADAKESPR